MDHIYVDILNTNNKWVRFRLTNVDTFIIRVRFGLTNTTRIVIPTLNNLSLKLRDLCL